MVYLKNSAVFAAAVFLSFIATACPNPAQDPLPDAPIVEPDTPVAEGPSTVIFGYIADKFGLETAGHWVGGKWHSYEGNDAYIYSGFELDGDIYAAGYTYDAGGN